MTAQSSSAVPALAVSGLRHRWPGGTRDLLRVDDWRVMPGERVLVLGPSGSGKSTLLSLLAGVTVASQGQVSLLGVDWAALSPARRDARRADHVGYIFQQFNLLPFLPVDENVALPCGFSSRRRERAGAGGVRAGGVRAVAHEWLDRLGLPADCWRRPAAELSVGQQQRVAAARALMGSPEVVIADEPTSALDEDTRDQYMQVLLAACAQAHAALVFVSHDRGLRRHFDRVQRLDAGQLVEAQTGETA